MDLLFNYSSYYLVLASPAHQDCWWLEIDQATESSPRIKKKCRIYLDFLTHGGTGPDNVPPRILFTTPDANRSDAIKNVITKLSTTETDQLICVTTHENAPNFFDHRTNRTITNPHKGEKAMQPLTFGELHALPTVVDLMTAARTLGIGRSKAYQLAHDGQFPCRIIRIGTHYNIPTADLLRLLGVTP